MFETLDKLMLAGLGALTMTRERAEKMFDEYVSKGEAARGGRAGFVSEVYGPPPPIGSRAGSARG
jgi:polyhydroxyalkanoate synthesis regulator phasin